MATLKGLLAQLRARLKVEDAAGHEHKPAGEGGGQFTSGGTGGGAATAEKPVAGAEKKKPGASKAKVDFSGVPAKLQKAGKVVFGPKVKLEDVPFASLVGAPDDANVIVTPTKDGKSFQVDIAGKGYEATRRILRKGSGELVCENEFIKIDDTGTGLGLEIFARQVEHCAAFGFGSIRCHAARAGNHGPNTFNGYYTWPRFGYDQDLDTLEVQREFKLVKEIRQRFPDAESIGDLMESKAGRDFWKEKGVDLLDARFDLSEGSRSRQTMEDYQLERAAARKWFGGKTRVMKAGNREDEPRREEIDLTPEEEAAIDRVWDRRGLPRPGTEAAPAEQDGTGQEQESKSALPRFLSVLRARLKGDFREEEHPRAEGGRFGDKPGAQEESTHQQEDPFSDEEPAKVSADAGQFLDALTAAFEDLDSENASERADRVDEGFESLEEEIDRRVGGYYEHFSNILAEDMGGYVEDLAPQAAEDFAQITEALGSDLRYALEQARDAFLTYASAIQEGVEDDVADGLIGQFESDVAVSRDMVAAFPDQMQERFDESYDAARAEAEDIEEGDQAKHVLPRLLKQLRARLQSLPPRRYP